MYRLNTKYAKNYCNRTLIVKVIIENVVTCFLGHSVVSFSWCQKVVEILFNKRATRPTLTVSIDRFINLNEL